MNMQDVNLDGHKLCKGLHSCQGDKKKRNGSFISFLPLKQNSAITNWSIYLKIALRWTNRNKFKKKMNPRRIEHASGL